MKEELIEFETAKLAKEKGYKVPCERCFCSKTNIEHNRGVVDWNSEREYEFSAPTQSLLQKWLREEHKIYLTVVVDIFTLKCGYEFFQVQEDSADVTEYDSNSDNWDLEYEEALEKGLQEALKLIKE